MAGAGQRWQEGKSGSMEVIGKRSLRKYLLFFWFGFFVVLAQGLGSEPNAGNYTMRFVCDVRLACDVSGLRQGGQPNHG